MNQLCQKSHGPVISGQRRRVGFQKKVVFVQNPCDMGGVNVFIGGCGQVLDGKGPVPKQNQ